MNRNIMATVAYEPETLDPSPYNLEKAPVRKRKTVAVPVLMITSHLRPSFSAKAVPARAHTKDQTDMMMLT